MHSRIIELGNAPILPADRMGECSVPEWFYHSIADYTNAETDRDEDLKWFLEIVSHIVDVAEDGESFTFKPYDEDAASSSQTNLISEVT